MPVQVWLQEWSWTESNKAKDLDRRNAGDGSALMDLSRLRQEPMFCYETCVKLLYWTALVYDYRLDGVSFTHTGVMHVHSCLWARRCSTCRATRQFLSLELPRAASVMRY